MKLKSVTAILTVLFLVCILVPINTCTAAGAQGGVFRKEFERPSTPEPDPDQPVPGLTAAEQEMFNLLNRERTSRGLRPLQVDMRLVNIARMKSQDMITNNYFSHYSPTYGVFTTMLRNNGISFRLAGENLAGASSTVQAHNSLMNSTDHRGNILRSGYTHVGIGIVNGGPYGSMFTQLFIIP